VFCTFCLQRHLQSPALGPCVVCTKQFCDAGTTQLQGAPHGATCACCDGAFLCYRHANEHAAGHASDVSICFSDLALAVTDDAARAIGQARGVARGSPTAEPLTDAFDRYLSVIRPAGHEEFRAALGLQGDVGSGAGAPLLRFALATALVPGIAQARLAALAAGATEQPSMFGVERGLPGSKLVSRGVFVARPFGQRARRYYAQIDPGLGELLGAVAPLLEEAGVAQPTVQAIEAVKLREHTWAELDRAWNERGAADSSYQSGA
jgi:hypothetical protein